MDQHKDWQSERLTLAPHFDTPHSIASLVVPGCTRNLFSALPRKTEFVSSPSYKANNISLYKANNISLLYYFNGETWDRIYLRFNKISLLLHLENFLWFQERLLLNCCSLQEEYCGNSFKRKERNIRRIRLVWSLTWKTWIGKEF